MRSPGRAGGTLWPRSSMSWATPPSASSCTALSVANRVACDRVDESTIRLDVLEHVSIEWARIFSRARRPRRRPHAGRSPRRGPKMRSCRRASSVRHAARAVELRIALDVTLARTIRVAFRKWKQGEQYLVGAEVDNAQRPYLAIVQPDGGEDEHRLAQRALAEDAARNIESLDELPPKITVELDADRRLARQHDHDVDRAGDESAARGATQIITADLDRLSDETEDTRAPARARRRSGSAGPHPARLRAREARLAVPGRDVGRAGRRSARADPVRPRVRRRRDGGDRRPAAVPRDQAQPPARARRAS